MTYLKKQMHTLYEIADAVISEIHSAETTLDPFHAPTVVFHNTGMAQWFKAYFLKKQDDVLMGVDFVTLSVFINDLVNPEGKYTIMDRKMMRMYVLKALLDNAKYTYQPDNAENAVNYIFRKGDTPNGNDDDKDRKGGTYNGNNAFDFADKLASLFMSYEMDGAEEALIPQWEKDLYADALQLAEKDGCYTTKALFTAADKGITKKITSPVYIVNNSYFSRLFEDMLSELDSDRITVFELNEAYEPQKIIEPVIAAPSEMREVEAVHSKICELIKNKEVDRYNDIVVYAPDINVYTTYIRRVFTQDNVEYPSIPFRIAGESKEKKDMYDSLRVLFDIATKGFFSRNDFYKFVKNPIIKRKWKIEEEDINAWMDAIFATNTHRDSEVSDDWNYIRKRLLSGMLVSNYSDISNKVSMKDSVALPYSAIDMDRKRVNLLIDIIKILKQWQSVFTDEPGKMNFSEWELSAAKDCLDAIYSVKNADEDETDYLYIATSDLMDQVIAMGLNVPGDTLLQMLMDIPNSYSVSPTDLYFGGVTFMNLKSDNIVSQKYAFIMGMSSNNFPRIDIKSEIDFHDVPISSKDLDESSIDRIIMNSAIAFFSYTDCDLTKDEPFYPSSAILRRVDNDLVKDLKFQVKMPLDESRDYDQLFTRTQFRGKRYFDGIGNVEGERSVQTKEAEKEAENKDEGGDNVLTLSDIKKFLECGFIYKYKKVLGVMDDDTEETQDEYEAIDVDGLKKYAVVKEMLLTDDSESDEQEKLDLEKKLPEKRIGKPYSEWVHKTSIEPIKEDFKSHYKKFAPKPLHLTTKDSAGNEFSWELRCNIDVWKKETEGEIRYLEAIDYFTEALKNKKYLNMYAASLMDIAGQDDEKTYKVVLGYDESGSANYKRFEISPEEAREILNSIYLRAIDYINNKYVDIDLIMVKNKSFTHSLNSLIDKIKDEYGGIWPYFDDKKMMNPYTDLGYNDDNCDSAEAEMDEIKKLIKFLS